MRILTIVLTLVLFVCSLGIGRAAVPPPLPKASATFQSGSLRVDVYGTQGKPAIVFIHGLAVGPWEWSNEIERFGPTHSIYALTLPGFDGQPAVDGALFETVSADFWDLLRTHNIAKPIVLGHSLGGTLGIDLAEQHPDQLGAVIAIDGLPVFPGFEQMTVDQRAQAITRINTAMAGETPQQFEGFERKYALPYLMTSAQDVDATAPLTARSDPAATARWMSEDLTLDLRPKLASATVPILVIAPYDGAIDGRNFVTPQAKQRYYEMLLNGAPRVKVQVIQPSRHFIMYDQPRQLDEAIQSFMLALSSVS